MTAHTDAPADTAMMGIVHDALRRDLARASTALHATPPPGDAQRRALGRHVAWMMHFLHAHHAGEDAGVWPLVREREPRARALVDEMVADHAQVAPLVDVCCAAAQRYADGRDDDDRVALRDALDRLTEVLLPHLAREEREAMPVVSVCITDAELRRIEKEHFIGPKSLAELGFEGHWLLDGLDGSRRIVVEHAVPPVIRTILLHGYRRRYRRHAVACWTDDADAGAQGGAAFAPGPRPPRRIPRSGQADVVVAATPEAVWQVIADVTRTGEWSHECRRLAWVGSATSAAPGVRFRGLNRAGPWTWSRENEVVAADPPHRLAWRTISTRLFPDSTEWTIELEPVEGGTRITQSFDVVKAPPLLASLYAIVVPGHRDRTAALADDLRRLGEVAARSAEHVPG